MRIAILTHGERPFGHLYAKAFTRAGHDAEILSLNPYASDWPDSKMRVINPGYFDPWKGQRRWPYIRLLRPLRRALREVQPDLLYSQYLTSAGVLACLSGHPCVVNSALGTDVNKRLGSRLWPPVFRWQARRCRFIHALSDDLAGKLQQSYGVDPQRIFVSPIGVDTEQLPYVPPDSRPSSGRILSTRAHKPVYDQPTLVRAAKRLVDRQVEFSVEFASERNVRLTKQVVDQEEIGDVVRFMDGFQDEALPSILGSADIYVSCSISDGTSQSLLEALSTGTFPVVSDIPANRPWITHGENGLLFPVGNDQALADRLEEAIRNPQLRAAAAPLNRQIAVQRGDLYALAAGLLERFENGNYTNPTR